MARRQVDTLLMSKSYLFGSRFDSLTPTSASASEPADACHADARRTTVLIGPWVLGVAEPYDASPRSLGIKSSSPSSPSSVDERV